RAALAAADRQARQRILEDLLEAEELDDAEIDGGVEAKAALVRTQRRIELHAEAAVDLHLALVVDPRHAEDDLALRLADALDQRVRQVAGMLGDDLAEAFEHFAHRLVEFGFRRVALQHLGKDGFKLLVDSRHGDTPFVSLGLTFSEW